MSVPRDIQIDVVHRRDGVPLRQVVAVIIGRDKRTVRLSCGHKKVVTDRRTQWTPCDTCAKKEIADRSLQIATEAAR